MQMAAENSILPGFHFLIASGFILVGTCIFWMYPTESVEIDIIGLTESNAEGKIINISCNSIGLSVQIISEKSYTLDIETSIVQNK